VIFFEFWLLGMSNNTIRQIEKDNIREVELGIPDSASWHADFKDSAYIVVKNLPYDLNEGDVIVVFSQYLN
jgi:RNA-binding motif X-linked protein 2